MLCLTERIPFKKVTSLGVLFRRKTSVAVDETSKKIKDQHSTSLILSVIRYDFFKNVNTLKISKFIRSYNKIKSPRKVWVSFVANYELAKKIADTILHHKNASSKMIVEVNPGLGLLTHFFSQSNVENIVLAQKAQTRNKEILSAAFGENKDKIEFRHLGFSRSLSNAIMFFKTLTEVYKGTPITVVGVIQNPMFFSALVKILSTDLIWKIHNMELFMVLNTKSLESITNFSVSSTRYYVYCLLNLYFTIDVITTFPREDFIPLSTDQDNIMHLVHMKKNSKAINLLDNYNIEYYVSFLRIMEKSRYAFVINTLEKWFPDCGIHLIREGVSCTNQIYEISAEESIAIFKILTECEGFATFKTLQPVFNKSQIHLRTNEVTSEQSLAEPKEENVSQP